MPTSNEDRQTPRRIRRTHQWGVGKLYPEKQYFLDSNIGDGLHTIQVGEQFVDILVRNRTSDTLVVFFHAAVGPQATYPSLSGDKSTEDVGLNLVSIADPTLQLSRSLRVGWHIGNQTVGDFPTFMKPIVDHVANQLNSTRLILVGASAGGYAAINFATHFPDSIVLALNPRLRLNSAPWPDITRMIQVAYGATGVARIKEARDRHMTMDLASNLVSGLPFHLALYQNTDDKPYFRKQFIPFVNTVGDDVRLWGRLESDGRGHVPIPSARLREMLTKLSDTALSCSDTLANAGFTQDFLHHIE